MPICIILSNNLTQMYLNFVHCWPSIRVAVEHGSEEVGKVWWQRGKRREVQRVGAGVVGGEEVIERGA